MSNRFIALSLLLTACGGTDSGAVTRGSLDGGTGGATNTGGASAGGVTNTGGANAGGGGVTNTGGASAGGVTNTGGANTGGMTTGGANTGGGSSSACQSPMMIPVGDGAASAAGDSGYDRCKNGAIRRRVAVTCPLGPSAAVSPCQPSDGQCKSDVDCTASPHGLCANSHDLLGYCGCFYGCFKDADCAPGSVCFCGDPVGSCVPATCTDDSKCAGSALCVSSSGSCSGGMGAFSCQNAEDECLGDADCSLNQRCILQGNRRMCIAQCLLPP